MIKQQPIGNHIHGVPFKDKGSLLQFKYVFQYPYLRLLVAYFVTFCNFVIYAEDPVAHSHSKCEIPLLGNAFSFIFTKYPPNGFSALKALMWITAVAMGMGVGKLIIHRWLFSRKLQLSMFSEDQGSWMISFLFTILVLVITSFIYNALLSTRNLTDEYDEYEITGYIGTKNSTFMRAAAVATWFGDFITAWMVTDMMLQETHRYKRWYPNLRRWWNKGMRRVVLFWLFSVALTATVIVIITTDLIDWDKFNRDVFYTNELGRSFLASFILVMDFTIVMQDWDFPMFDSNNLDIKLPGVNTASIKFNFPERLTNNMVIHITGKWFQYGILFIVLLLDLNMWKNQIFYEPILYGQYTGPQGRIYSVSDTFSLNSYGNETIYSYLWRKSTVNPLTNSTYITEDHRTNSRYRGYPLKIKAIAFTPSILTFIVFGLLIHCFGKKQVTPVVPVDDTKTDSVGALDYMKTDSVGPLGDTKTNADDLVDDTKTDSVGVVDDTKTDSVDPVDDTSAATVDANKEQDANVENEISKTDGVINDVLVTNEVTPDDVHEVTNEPPKTEKKVTIDVGLQADEDQITQVEGVEDEKSVGSYNYRPRYLPPASQAELKQDYHRPRSLSPVFRAELERDYYRPSFMSPVSRAELERDYYRSSSMSPVGRAEVEQDYYRPQCLPPSSRAELERDLLLCELRVANCDLRVNQMSEEFGMA